MKGGSAILGLLAWLALASGAVGQQLKDSEFTVPTKPEAFTEKTMFPPPAPAKAPEKEAPRTWSGGVELGLNGSAGNSDVFKLRFGANGTVSCLERLNAFEYPIEDEQCGDFAEIDAWRIIGTWPAGGTANATFDPGQSVLTMTAFIGKTATGDIGTGTITYDTIFAVGALLFVLTLGMNAVAIRLVRRFREVYE